MYKYYATRTTDLENKGTAQLIKTNMTNLIDGGEVINITILPNNQNVLIDYVSGSVSGTPHPGVVRKLTNFLGLISSNGPLPSNFVETTEEVFNAAYSQSLSHINNIQ